MNRGKGTIKWALLVVMAILVPGCSKDLPRLSGPQLEAVNHNQRGIRAEARGDHDVALEEFTEALQINSAIDNNDGRVVALVNISRASRSSGDLKRAQEAVDKALRMTTPASSLFSEAAFEKSSLELQSHNLPVALEWGMKAEASGQNSRPGSKTNLVARILFLENRYDAAKEKADQALALNRANKDMEEEANSLRLLGGIYMATGHTDTAMTSYEQALAVDKSLGKSRKIALDLRGMAAVHSLSSKYDQAVDLYQRAYSVSLNGGDPESAAGDLLQMAQLYQKSGKAEQSVQLLKERDELLRKAKVR